MLERERKRRIKRAQMESREVEPPDFWRVKNGKEHCGSNIFWTAPEVSLYSAI